MKRVAWLMALCALGVFAIADSALACSVCFGDPESPMTKGAVAGVVVMVGIVGFVLMGIAGTACFWMVRVRRMQLSLPTSQDRS